MKKLLVLFVLIWALSKINAQSISIDGVYNTIWQDSLTSTTDTVRIINLYQQYDQIYLAGSDTAATLIDSIKVQSGTIRYKIGSDAGGNLQYLPKDTIWVSTQADSMGTIKVSSLLLFPPGANEYYIKNFSMQLFRIVILNKNSSKLYYYLRATKHKSY